MPIKKLPGLRLADRELKVLKLLWKWKLMTNAALTSKRLFPKTSPKRAYNRLLDLKHAGLITVQSDEKLQNFAWALTAKGFSAIREFLPDLREEGYRSENFAHDLLLSAFHLGDWLVERPANAKFISEQELRRLHFEEYPSWVPRSDLHRPDGFLGFAVDKEIVSIAIEVEISRKVASKYYSVAEYYSDDPSIHRVLWLVPSGTDVNRIRSAIRKTGAPQRAMHNFVLVPHFKESGWQSKIIAGPETNQTLITWLLTLARERAGNSAGPFTTRLLLNTQRSFARSKASPKSFTVSDSLLTTQLHG